MLSDKGLLHRVRACWAGTQALVLLGWVGICKRSIYDYFQSSADQSVTVNSVEPMSDQTSKGYS
jgi:hypothetical protein